MKHPTMEGTLDAQVVYRNRLYAQVYKMIQESAVDAFDEASEEFLSSTGGESIPSSLLLAPLPPQTDSLSLSPSLSLSLALSGWRVDLLDARFERVQGL